jgi:hypothetical protein
MRRGLSSKSDVRDWQRSPANITVIEYLDGYVYLWDGGDLFLCPNAQTREVDALLSAAPWRLTNCGYVPALDAWLLRRGTDDLEEQWG